MLLSSMTHLCLIAIINEEVKENFKCENNTRLRCIQGVIRKKKRKKKYTRIKYVIKKIKIFKHFNLMVFFSAGFILD